MAENMVVWLSIPGLQRQDLSSMPNLNGLAGEGESATLTPSFPCVTWPVQANALTGKLPRDHGVTANGFYWRESREVEMWTAWNEKILAPQIWDVLHQRDPALTSAVWFPMLSKGCGADYVCMPAPIHNPDGSESLWCYTKPTELYGELRDQLGHFPLQNFWGPLAGIPSTAWIIDSAVIAASRLRPRFFYLYLPHLDYAAQKSGPDSDAAKSAVAELDEAIGRLVAGFAEAYGDESLTWLATSEYVITPVDHVTYPNRALRDAGLLKIRQEDDGEHLDLEASQAWALVDHQFSHLYLRDNDQETTEAVVESFAGQAGIAELLAGEERAKYAMNHERSGDVILISTANSWQAYYWWLDDAAAPGFARTVDIHRKPGYDPVELHWDREANGVPLDATLIKGSHGAPANDVWQKGVAIASRSGVLPKGRVRDTDLFGAVLGQYGIDA